jgi:hypothetical protein
LVAATQTTPAQLQGHRALALSALLPADTTTTEPRARASLIELFKKLGQAAGVYAPKDMLMMFAGRVLLGMPGR